MLTHTSELRYGTIAGMTHVCRKLMRLTDYSLRGGRTFCIIGREIRDQTPEIMDLPMALISDLQFVATGFISVRGLGFVKEKLSHVLK